MFYSCFNLEYINLINFEENKLNSFGSMFSYVPLNVVVLLKENVSTIIYDELKNSRACYNIVSTDDWKSKQKKIIHNNNDDCIDSCDNSSQYPYEYNGECYSNCTHEFLYDEYGHKINKCKCELEQCLLCPKVAFHYKML